MDLKSNLKSIKSKISEKLKGLKLPGKLPAKKAYKKPAEKAGMEMRAVERMFKDFLYEGKDVLKHRFAILGIGNDLKGDDGVGWHVIDKLRKEFRNDKNLLLIKTSVPENHVKQITDFAPKMLLVIDAADFKKPPGTIKSISQYQVKESFISTHTTPVTLLLRLYQSDRPIKKQVTLIGIQMKSKEFGQPMSEPVRKAGDRLVKIITKLYRKNILDLSLEKELIYSSNPLRRLLDYFRGKRTISQSSA